MKIRSALLVACIVVVPLIAMFSHRIPPGARAAVNAFVRDLAGTARSQRPAPVPDVPAQPLPEQPEAASVVETTAAVAADVSRVVPVAAAGAGADSWGRLRDLGAVAIDCRPLRGDSGHVASCRLPVDGAGQLERVFQSTGADATAAVDNLLRDVTAWRRGATSRGPATMRF